jgi:hypothetical protein
MQQSNLAWETLTPIKKSSFGIGDVDAIGLQFHNGLVVGQVHESVEIWEYHGASGLQSVAKHSNIGFGPERFAFDRAQDLLILLEDTRYARSLDSHF